eukprot:gene17519-20859_t
MHKNNGPGIVGNDPCIYTAWIRESTDRVTSDETRKEMYDWLIQNCPTDPDTIAEDRDFASAPVMWGFDANRVDIEHFIAWKDYAWNKDMMPQVGVSRTDFSANTMIANGVKNTGNPSDESTKRYPTVRYELVKKRDFIFEKVEDSKKDDWMLNERTSVVTGKDAIVQIPSDSTSASWDLNMLKMPNGRIAMANNDANFVFPAGVDQYTTAAAQWAVDPVTLEVKQATSLPTRYNFVVVGGKAYTVESRMRGPSTYNNHLAALRLIQVDPDDYSVIQTKDLTCALGKASKCNTDGTYIVENAAEYLQLNILGVLPPEDDTPDGSVPAACEGKGGVIVGTSGYPYYEALGQSDNIAALGIVKYDYHPSVAMVCANDDLTVAWRYDNGGVYKVDETAERNSDGDIPKFHTKMPEVNDMVPNDKFVRGVKYVATMSKTITNAELVVPPSCQVNTLEMDLSKMLPSKITLRLTQPPNSEPSAPILKVNDILQITPVDKDNYPKPTLLIVTQIMPNSVLISAEVMSWNGMNFDTRDEIQVFPFGEENIPLQAVKTTEPRPVGVNVQDIAELTYVIAIPTDTENTTPKSKVTVKTISIKLDTIQLETIGEGLSTKSSSESHTFNILSEYVTSDDVDPSENPFELLEQAVNGNVFVLKDKEILLFPQSLKLMERSQPFESEAEIQGMFNWGGSFWAQAAVDVEHGSVALPCGNGHRDSIPFILATQHIKHRVNALDLVYQTWKEANNVEEATKALENIASHMELAGKFFQESDIVSDLDKQICQSGGLVLDLRTGEEKANIRGHAPDSWVVYGNTYAPGEIAAQTAPWEGEDRARAIYSMGFDSWRDLDGNNVVVPGDDSPVMLLTTKGGANIFVKRDDPKVTIGVKQLTALPQSAPGTTAPFNFHGACYVGDGIFALRTPATDQAVHLQTREGTSEPVASTAGWLSIVKVDLPEGANKATVDIVHQLDLGSQTASNHASAISCAGGQVGVFTVGADNVDDHEYRIYDIGNCDHTKANSCRFSSIPIPKIEVLETRYAPVTAMWDAGYLFVKSDTSLRKFVIIPGIGDDEVDERNPALTMHSDQLRSEGKEWRDVTSLSPAVPSATTPTELPPTAIPTSTTPVPESSSPASGSGGSLYMDSSSSTFFDFCKTNTLEADTLDMKAKPGFFYFRNEEAVIEVSKLMFGQHKGGSQSIINMISDVNAPANPVDNTVGLCTWSRGGPGVAQHSYRVVQSWELMKPYIARVSESLCNSINPIKDMVEKSCKYT